MSVLPRSKGGGGLGCHFNPQEDSSEINHICKQGPHSLNRSVGYLLHFLDLDVSVFDLLDRIPNQLYRVA